MGGSGPSSSSSSSGGSSSSLYPIPSGACKSGMPGLFCVDMALLDCFLFRTVRVPLELATVSDGY